MKEILPDHPVIAAMERTGYPDGQEQAVTEFCEQCGCEVYAGENLFVFNQSRICPDCFREAIDDLTVFELAARMDIEISKSGGGTAEWQ